MIHFFNRGNFFSKSAIAILVCVLFSFNNCGQKHKQEQGPSDEITMVYVGADGLPAESNIKYKIIHDKYVVFSGDMILGTIDDITPDGKILAHFSTANKSSRQLQLKTQGKSSRLVYGANKVNHVGIWPNGEVPYFFDTNVPSHHQRLFDNLVADFNLIVSDYNLRLVKKNHQALAVQVKFDSSQLDSCLAKLGYQVNSALLLGPNCFNESLLFHEFMHILGFAHEHQRGDRDDHIKIHYENIISTYQNQFEIAASTLYEGPYDTHSITHYPSHFFSKNGQPTITERVNGRLITDPTRLSQGDLAAIGELYGTKRLNGSDRQGLELVGARANFSLTTEQLIGRPIDKPYVLALGELNYVTEGSYCLIKTESTNTFQSFFNRVKTNDLFQDIGHEATRYRSLMAGKKLLKSFYCPSGVANIEPSTNNPAPTSPPLTLKINNVRQKRYSSTSGELFWDNANQEHFQSIRIEWQAKNGQHKQSQTLGPVRSFFVNDLGSAGEFEFWLTPINKQGQPGDKAHITLSSYGQAIENENTTTTPLLVETVPAPQNLTISNISSHSIEIRWQNFAAADKFNIYRNDRYLTTISGKNNFISQNLSPKTKYNYYITAVKNNVISKKSAVVSATTGENALTAVENNIESFDIRCQPASKTAFEIFWNKDSDPNIRYNILRNHRLIKSNLDAHSLWQDQMAPGKYIFVVQKVKNGKVIKAISGECSTR